MPNLPRKFTAWPEQASALSLDDLIKAYEGGWQGAVRDPASEEALRHDFAQQTGYSSLGDLATSRGWADSGAGKLVLCHHIAESVWPGMFPGDRQTVGSCVSHGQAKSLSVTLACEIVANRPDPLTGKMEGKPDVPAEGIQSGVVHPSPIYWARGYNGHGWSCSTAARVVVNEVGIVLCKNYQELGVDLTNVTNRTETLYGSRKPPEEWQKEFALHRVASAAELSSFEEVRDALYNGYGINTCGSEGFSSQRDENGVSRRSGSWAHSMAVTSVDDRKEIKSKYGEPLVLVQNSWEKWNGGPRRILGTNIDIPEGSFWARWSDVKRRYFVAFSNVAGWPPQKLPHLRPSFPE